jgi:hypothetical protein
MNVPAANLMMAWLWMLAGFLSGLALGLKFHREEWLGGYASHRRRLYRLGHISFFGLGVVNFMFFLTARLAPLSEPAVGWAGAAFILGAASMPVCCALMAHWPKLRMLFAVPVISLIAGAVITLKALL